MKGEKMKNNGKIINKLFRNSVISIILAAIATMIGIVIGQYGCIWAGNADYQPFNGI